MIDVSEDIKYYYNRPVEFAKDVLNITPTKQQAKFLTALITHKKIAVKSGHGVGKSAASAMAVFWFLICRDHAQIIITAPSKSQVELALWARISELWNSLNPVFKQFFKKQSNRIYYKSDKENWYVVAKTSNKEKPESMQGPHADNLMYILDEASAVPDEIYVAVYGSLTGKNNYLLLLSNPTRMSGEFYDAFRSSGSDFKKFTFNSEESELVSEVSRARWAKFGKKSNEYRVRVLGQFPNQEAGTLIPWEWVNAAADRYKAQIILNEAFEDEDTGITSNMLDINTNEIIWGLDIGAGGDLSVLAKRRGNVLYEIKTFDFSDTMELCGAIGIEYKQTPQEYKPVNINCDEGGVGKGPVDRMKELKLPVTAVNSAWASTQPEHYLNVRAEMWCAASDWFRDDEPMIVDNKKLIEQITTMRTVPHSRGVVQMEKKEVYKKRHKGESPDEADACCLTLFTPKPEVEFKIYQM